MRQLTLDEKISLKGIMEQRGEKCIPRLDMSLILKMWHHHFGKSPLHWYKVPLQAKSWAGHTAWRLYAMAKHEYSYQLRKSIWKLPDGRILTEQPK